MEGVMSDNQQVKLTMLMLLAFFMTSHGVGNIHCSKLPESSTDMLALLGFRANTKDPTGALSSWNNSIHYCKWWGVTCNPKNSGRVTALNLAGHGLSGSIGPSVGNLTFLHTLDLSSNQFSGQLPHLSNLQKMQVLKLNQNSLNGTLPDKLTNCSNLKELHLYSNSFEGAIPREIGLLTNLVLLGLSYNNLTGTIPATVGNITHLETLYLGYNQLEGNIPDELGQLSNISIMDLSQINLSGSIPERIFNLSSLQQLGLSGNQLSKSLPNDVGDRLSSLGLLSLDQNMLEGHLPDSLGNASMLQLVSLQSNRFTGQIPSSFARLSRLSTLNLQQNMLQAKDSESWQFLQALENCSALQRLQLADNQLQGLIPNSVGNLPPSLQYLTLGGNNLSGVVPPSIGNLSALLVLALDENSLTGNIGHWIAKLNHLQGLYLSKNNFNGPIPSLVGNLMQLIELYLDNNGFEGPIPPSLGRLPLLLKLDLSHNNLGGSIPPEVSNLKQLFNLQLASNKLTGEIPEALGQCQNLAIIQMDQNILTGGIPVSFGNLKSLNILNLSGNKLSGTIPTVLKDLTLLSKLDLSHNHLEGEIPRNGIFENATAVSLDGNWELCGGAAELHMPPCLDAVSKKVEWKGNLFRILISIFSFMSFIMLIYIIIHGRNTSRRPYLLLFSFGKKFPVVSYKDLTQATGKFSESNLIGKGSYGSVYKGKLTQAKIQVAIKVFDLEMRCADKSFVSECEVFRDIRHRNLLPILTACSTIDDRGNDFKALIYEFMHNGNLDTWLHHRRSCVAPKGLSLVQRISIAVDIADAVAYLHHDCGRPIVHCDLKPTNILLDDDMNAYLGDFGIASLVLDSRPTTHERACCNSSVDVTGTIGYIPPEYAQSVRASTHGDVYSFGIVLLEMLIGKRPTDSMFEDGLSIVSLMEKNFPDQVFRTIDAHLQEECKGFIQSKAQIEDEVYRCLLSLVQVALSCTRGIPRERMNMREVAVNLHSIRRSYVAEIK